MRRKRDLGVTFRAARRCAGSPEERQFRKMREIVKFVKFVSGTGR